MIDSAPILYVDLSSRRVWTEPMGDGDRKLLLGGRGWAASTLWRLTSGSTKPDSPENPLILAAGALAGTHAPSAGRLTVVSLSPATRLYLKSSSGEHFAHELRFAGYSALVVIGKSEKPTCLLIRDGEVEIVDASEIWGKDVRETTLAVQELMGANDAQVGCIGPAGEKGVHFSSLMFNIYSAAARGGPGAVMGSKNLKAIAVRGSRDLPVHDVPALRAESAKAYAYMKQHKFFKLWQ
ncbi:MAG: aldehyde ferredoxin oxidoreductase, partial [Deltaproteobacteria bacterium]|nr:aldehyde ferredoxin oxidoreductase [Deltaproteobacteria bacterium]